MNRPKTTCCFAFALAFAANLGLCGKPGRRAGKRRIAACPTPADRRGIDDRGGDLGTAPHRFGNGCRAFHPRLRG
jgi:hypothetical protein